jgi:hypothetical protein
MGDRPTSKAGPGHGPTRALSTRPAELVITLLLEELYSSVQGKLAISSLGFSNGGASCNLK